MKILEFDPKKLIVYRGLAGWSQQKLAQRSGVTKTTILRLENGRNQPRASTLQKLSLALRIKPRDLLKIN